ncbi:MAG TPA: hypothetical protein PKC18_09605, partial [Lacipirellulaceae bacterium]|nr:hypothetical protein [Lacipirellulaceae bacterium]
PTRGRGVELLAQTRLLAAVLPEVSAAIDDESAWAAALDRLERPPAGAGFPLALAALLLGAAAPEDVPRIGRRLKLANKEIDRAAWLVRMLPQIDDAERLPWPRLQRILSHDGAAELIALAQAHWGAGHAGIERCRTVLDQPAAQWNPPPLVSGDDLVAAGLRPGRQFAALLDHLRDLQLTGRLTTPAEALAEAAQWTAAEGPVDEPGAGA